MQKRSLHNKIYDQLSCWLSCDTDPLPKVPLTDFDQLVKHSKLGDVWLVEGRSRVSHVINLVTRSAWSHAALFIGKLTDIADPTLRQHIRAHYHGKDDEPLLIESMLEQGVIVTPVCRYRQEHLRLCRPKGLTTEDAWKLVRYTAQYLGCGYDTRQIFDLLRFLLPWAIFPRRWRSSLLTFKAGISTKLTCSLLLAEAFASVKFPVLPMVIEHRRHRYEFIRRNPRLFTPRDFDYSPFFESLKFPIVHFSEKHSYHDIYWNQDGLFSNDQAGIACLLEKQKHREEHHEN